MGSSLSEWTDGIINAVRHTCSAEEAFEVIRMAAADLGFEHCALGARGPLPLRAGPSVVLSNQPAAWQARYAQAGYLHVDPTVRHGTRSNVPQVWSDHLFRNAEALWHEARSAGLRHGWAQSSLDAPGVGSMLTLSRSSEALTTAELACKQARMQRLVQVAHVALGRTLFAVAPPMGAALTLREREVLQWAAHGKTAEQISDRLSVSAGTINLHIKNATHKLGTSGKAATVVRAQFLHLLG